MSMKIIKTIELEDFEVPERVKVKDSKNSHGRTYHVSLLNWEVLNELCNNFRASVFEAANIIDSKGE